MAINSIDGMHNRWYALLYMDKQIGIPQEEMPPIRDFDEVREKFGL